VQGTRTPRLSNMLGTRYFQTALRADFDGLVYKAPGASASVGSRIRL
jgi:hypothetical protein